MCVRIISMDIQILGEDSLRIKTKKTALVIDPKAAIQKLEADAILLTAGVGDTSRVTDYRVVIDGIGEYEVSGLKIISMKSEDDLVFALVSENVRVLVA